MTIAISVIVPTNRPQLYLSACLNSLIEQTLDHKWFEVLIIINGCSFDEYIECSKQWVDEQKYCDFKFIYEPIGAVSRARNIGLDQAIGSYITFIDDDDIVSENYLKELYNHVDTNQISIANVHCFKEDISNYYYDYLGKSFTSLFNKEYNLLTHRKFLSTCWAKLIPITVISSMRFNESIDMGEDGLFMASIINNIEKLKLSSEDCVYNRRITAHSLSRGKKSKSYVYRQRLKLMHNYIKIWFKHPLSTNSLFILSRLAATIVHLVKKS